MVASETLDIINYTKDIDIEYNIKILILGVIMIYSLILIYISYRWDNQEYWALTIKYFLMLLPSISYLFFFPLLTIFLFRSASWELIYKPLIIYFSYSFIIIAVALKLGMIKFVLNMFGFTAKFDKMELKKK